MKIPLLFCLDAVPTSAARPIGSVIILTIALSFSAVAFVDRFLSASMPVIISGAMDDWPAMGAGGSRGWADLEYLKTVAGSRLVPVEICDARDASQTYLSPSWNRVVMTLSEYIDSYVACKPTSSRQSSENQRGYLAQHALFAQIPELKRDFSTLAYCHELLASDKDRVAESDDDDDDLPADADGVRTSAWLGPSGTVSPLHHDPYHNLLAQVVGYKYVRLFDAKDSHRLYPRDGPQCNNSRIDLDAAPDPDLYPKFKGTPSWQAVLGPGEVLYIPRLCWHYVRGLSQSFSISFWWGARVAADYAQTDH